MNRSLTRRLLVAGTTLTLLTGTLTAPAAQAQSTGALDVFISGSTAGSAEGVVNGSISPQFTLSSNPTGSANIWSEGVSDGPYESAIAVLGILLALPLTAFAALAVYNIAANAGIVPAGLLPALPGSAPAAE